MSVSKGIPQTAPAYREPYRPRQAGGFLWGAGLLERSLLFPAAVLQ
ncbi:MAG: hypothetical protein MJA29_02190 [Candidatus Omnitrophica bacterium]|nr:hypothetical protein [Candidatus Omnitrophota bacterium]